jgi:hypothetical protein
VSAQAIVCSNCGAGLEPRALETKVKCNYCMTVFVIVRDHEGVSGLAAEGAAVPPASGSTSASALPAGTAPATSDPIAAMTGMDPQTVARLERDAMAVVGGIMAQEARQVARGGSCALVGLLLFASSFAAVECAWRVLLG